MAKTIKPAKTPDQQIGGLRKYNVVAGFLHLIQAVGFAYVLTMLDYQISVSGKNRIPNGSSGSGPVQWTW